MALDDCIREIIDASGGKIDETEAKRLLYTTFGRAERYQKDGLSRGDAALRAARELGDEERIAAAIEKRNTLINKMRREELGKRAVESRASVRTLPREVLNQIDAEAHARTDQLHGGVIGELRQAGLLKAVVKRDKAFERDIGRELWRLEDPTAGAPTGNRFAVQVAEILHRYQEAARRMQNDAGAYIGKLDHYVTRQSHDMEKIRGKGDAAAFQGWRDFIEPKLDERTFEGVDNPESFLRDVWDALASGVHEKAGGADWLTGFTGPANLAKRASQERKLHFKNADDWLAYNERFGRGNVVDSVLRGLEHAGRNSALMRTLGPNPEAMFKSWRDDIASAAKDRNDFKTSDAMRGLRGWWDDRVMDQVTGLASQPVSMRLAHVGQGIRTMESLAKLGGVVLSSIPDIAVNASTLRRNGVPLLESYAQQALAPLRGRRSGEQREIADMLGIGIDTMLGRMLSRFHVEDRVSGSGSKLVEWFHRANLLSYWTDSMKTGVGLILSNNLARNKGRTFAQLPEMLQTTLRRYEIGSEQWNAIRQVETRAADGKNYVLAGQIADLPDEAIAHLAKSGGATVIPNGKTWADLAPADFAGGKKLRLYRGETTGGQAHAPGSPATGGWFTTDPKKAALYGKVSHLDVDRNDLRAFIQGHGGADEFITTDPTMISRQQPGLGPQPTSAAELGRIREDLQSKLGSYLVDQTREAMTEPRATDRAAATLGTRAGTPAGEAIRLLGQFKQYPITFFNRTLSREAKAAYNGGDVAGIAHLIAATTILGYVSMTAKELAKGRNPRQPEDAADYGKLVMAAMQQGGGLGIYGDFLFGQANRMGGGLISSLAGPTAGTLEDAHKVFTAIRGGEDPSAQALQAVKNNTPFMNLFYTRAALDYFILHRLQEAANPGYLRRYEQRVKKDNDQTFWLRPSASPY